MDRVSLSHRGSILVVKKTPGSDISQPGCYYQNIGRISARIPKVIPET